MAHGVNSSFPDERWYRYDSEDSFGVSTSRGWTVLRYYPNRSLTWDTPGGDYTLTFWHNNDLWVYPCDSGLSLQMGGAPWILI